MPKCFFRPSLWTLFRPVTERAPDLFLAVPCAAELTSPQPVDQRFVWAKSHSRIEEIEVKQNQEGIEEGIQDLTWLGVNPDGAKSKDADQFTHTSLQPFRFSLRIRRLVHAGLPLYGICSPRPSAKFAEELFGGRKKRILLQSSTDDDQWMCAHDIDHGIASQLREVVSANDRVVVPAPDVIHTRFKFNDVLQPGTFSNCPIHSTHDAAERKPSRCISGSKLFESIEHPVLIEFTIAKIGFSVYLDFQLPSS